MHAVAQHIGTGDDFRSYCQVSDDLGGVLVQETVTQSTVAFFRATSTLASEMITIRSQFLGFKIGGWQDQYEIQTTDSEARIIQAVSQCIGCPVIGRSFDGSFLFRRGSRFWTWFSFGPERLPLQEISVRFEDRSIILRYRIIGGIWLRGKPCGLEKEARRIASYISEAGEQDVDPNA